MHAHRRAQARCRGGIFKKGIEGLQSVQSVQRL
jgi:hypothetical protein